MNGSSFEEVIVSQKWYVWISHIQKITKIDHRPNVRTKTTNVYNSYNSTTKDKQPNWKMGKGFK